MLRVSTSFQHCGSCLKYGDSASVSVARIMWMCDSDASSGAGENSKKSSSSAIST